MKVEQFINRNQFHMYQYNDSIHEDELQSYNSLVVSITTINENNKKVITLGIDWDYSMTTSKHVYMFLEQYGNVSFNGITNKRAYINKLIADGVIQYDENMR